MPEKQNAIYNLSHQLHGHSYLHHDDEKKNALKAKDEQYYPCHQ